MNGKQDDFYAQIRQLGAVTTIPIVLLIGPVVGFFMGGWIDRKFHIYPWFTIILVFLGFAGSAREVARLLRQVSKETDKQP